MDDKRRTSFSQEQRRQAWETTTEVAKRQLEAERRLRDEKTRKLRAARLELQQTAEREF